MFYIIFWKIWHAVVKIEHCSRYQDWNITLVLFQVLNNCWGSLCSCEPYTTFSDWYLDDTHVIWVIPRDILRCLIWLLARSWACQGDELELLFYVAGKFWSNHKVPAKITARFEWCQIARDWLKCSKNNRSC